MIEYEKRAMIEAEDKYTFRQSTQISMQTGLIGHLRADMDTDGNGFFSSWFDFREELKTDEFKAEFDEVINSLREEGDILHNRRALAKYCYCTPCLLYTSIEENQVHSYNMRKNSHWRSSHEKESHVVRAPAFCIAFRMRRRAPARANGRKHTESSNATGRNACFL